MNILVYYPYNQRSVEQQSVMEMLVKRGHRVVLLTTCPRGYLHDFVEKMGVIAEAADAGSGSKIGFYRKNYKKLKKIIQQYQIETVIAQQQEPALIAGMLRRFKKFRLLYFRHNTDESYKDHPRKAKWLNKWVNALTPVKVAPSEVVKQFWIGKEKVPARQIRRINYGYNFDQYEKPVPAAVERIRDLYPAKLLLISMARLVPAKRHREMFSVVSQLVQEGYDCKMICLGAGQLEEELKKWIESSGMKENIFLTGPQTNIFDYIAAADVFLHLSSTEASNSSVKEAALCKKTAIVCKEVGDFSEYIVNGQNGFLVDQASPVNETVAILKGIAGGNIDTAQMGAALYKTVKETFDINNVAQAYDRLLQE